MSHAKRTKRSKTRNKNVADRKFGEFEQLEDKRCLAFLGFFDGITLDINQTADDGDIVIENSTGVWRATDNASTFTFVAAQNIEINLLDNTANQLDLALDLPHAGDVTANLGDGVRDMMFTGAMNDIGGDLSINSGAGTQLITPMALIVHGSAAINLGMGEDIIDGATSSLTVEGNLNMSGVNYTSDPGVLPIVPLAITVGLPTLPPTPGDVTIDNSGEDQESSLVFAGAMFGDFSYTGNVNIDEVDLGTLAVTGDVNIDLDIGNPFFGNPQLIRIEGQVEGDVIMTAGDSNLGNVVDLTGNFLGNIVSYTGGDLVDTVNYAFVGTQADVFAIMGGGDDVFDLMMEVNLLEIDFGNDLGDQFLNNVGPINFEFDITNFQFFDHFYTALDDTLVMNQLADVGDIVIDNDGGLTGFDWQMFTAIGGFTSTAQAENLILNLLSNTGDNLEIDLFNPVIASITMDLGDGDRLVQFTGIANNPLRDINITAGAGNQDIDLSVNSPLGVATLNIDLGTGFDSVDDNANNLIIDEDLIFTGVNHFEHAGILFVARNAFIDTSGETEDSLFASNGSFFVGNFFTYTGGAGADEVRLNGAGGAVITRDATIDLGDSGVTDQFVRVDSPLTTFMMDLDVSSTNATSTDWFLSSAGTEFMGNLSIDFGGGTNVVEFLGVFGGTSVSYAGGSGVDTVIYGLTGTPAAVTILLGDGDDSLTLAAGSAIGGPLVIDFGNDNDTFVNNFGNFTFDAMLLGLQGFDYTYVFATDSLTADQISDTGNVEFDNLGLGNAFRYNNSFDITSASNFSVTMLGGTNATLDIDLDFALAGDLTVNLGDGARALNFIGFDNSIGGHLTVAGGSGDQTVEVAVNNTLTVGGHASFDLGTGFDAVDEDANDINIVGNLNFIGVNDFENNGVMFVGGNVDVDSSFETEAGRFDDDTVMLIVGDFTYLGGNGNDLVTMNGVGSTIIGGNVFVDVGNNLLGGDQEIFFNVATSSVGGTLTVVSTSSANPDIFVGNPAATFGGDIDIDLGGGANSASIVGVFGGSNITYNGGSGVDDVDFGTTGSPADVLVNLGADNDTFTLLAGASIQPTTLTVDFGPGNDTFDNQYGAFDFNAILLNLDGFNHIYTNIGQSLTSTQVSAVGPLTIDNNGTNDAIRFINGGTTELTPVTDLTVNLVDGTDSLDVQMDNGHNGDLTLNLGNGARAVNFTGTNNLIGNNLTVTAGSGAQTVELAVNAALAVFNNISIDLGNGADVVDEDGNDITLLGDLTFVGVNFFENNGTMFVGANVVVDTTGETEDTQFDDDATMTIAGDFTYTGGDGRDEVTMNGVAGGTSVLGNAFVDVGDNTTGGVQFIFFNLPNASVDGTLTAISTSATNFDSFALHPAGSYGGDIDVDLGGGPNDAVFAGVFGGSNITYNGGGGVDNVVFGTTGSPADVLINLGAGDDTFTLQAGASIQPTTLTVDFGGGNDTFINNYGNFDFNANLLNLDGFNHIYTHVGMTLTSTQVSASANITVDNNGTNNAIRFIDGGTSELTPVTDLTINMQDGSGTNLNMVLDNAFAGDLTIDLGDGTRALNFDGVDNSIGGDLTILGGSGTQTVELAINNTLSVGGNGLIDLGQGSDLVDEDSNDIDITGDLDLTGVNIFDNDGNMSVGGNLTVDNSNELVPSTFRSDNSLVTGGNFSYTGSSTSDDVILNAGTTIGGSVNIKGSNGSNTVVLRGTFNGAGVLYNGGSGTDDVTYGFTGTPTNPNIKLSTGNDSFTLDAGTAIDSFLRVDFGGGLDSISNNFGAFTFDARLLNLNGFSRFYDLATDSMNMEQVVDTGDVTIDNNGAGNALRLTTTGVTEMTPASNVRLVFLDNSSGDVTVDYDSALAGEMILQLRSGTRDVMFTGTSNSIGGLLRIEASDGVQDIDLAVNADLNVGASLVINGRDGADVIDDGANSIFVNDALILRGINEFRIDNILNVGGGFNMVTVLEAENNVLQNNGFVTIGNDFQYLGGGGADRVLFDSGNATINGFTYVHLGESNAPFIQQEAHFIGSYSTDQLYVVGGDSNFGTDVFIAPSTVVAGGDVIVNLELTSTTNTVGIFGNFTGTYGTYRGGSDTDVLSLGPMAPNMFFYAAMNDGDDTFVLEASADLQALVVDFGAGNDSFIDNLGMPYPFPVTLLNL